METARVLRRADADHGGCDRRQAVRPVSCIRTTWGAACTWPTPATPWRPARAGLGLGRELVKDSLAQAARKGFRGLQFNAVVASNEAAIHLYEDLGFTRVGTIPGGFCSILGNFEDVLSITRIASARRFPAEASHAPGPSAPFSHSARIAVFAPKPRLRAWACFRPERTEMHA